jgi:hypothetical protein
LGYHDFHWDNFYVMNTDPFTNLQSLGPNGNAIGYIGDNGYTQPFTGREGVESIGLAAAQVCFFFFA